MSTNEPMSYIARCSVCSGIVMAVVDNPKHARDTAREVADCIRDGYQIERVTCEYVRQNWAPCKCGEPEAMQTIMELP